MSVSATVAQPPAAGATGGGAAGAGVGGAGAGTAGAGAGGAGVSLRSRHMTSVQTDAPYVWHALVYRSFSSASHGSRPPWYPLQVVHSRVADWFASTVHFST
jgi:hypothetical protein